MVTALEVQLKWLRDEPILLVRTPEVDVERLETRQVLRQTRLEAPEIFPRRRRPERLGERRRAGKRHVLHVLRPFDVLGPDLRLRAKNMSRVLRLELGGERLVGVDR